MHYMTCMRTMKPVISFLLFCLCLSDSTAQIIWDKEHLKAVKESLQEPFYQEAYQSLRESADRLLSVEPLSVVMKESIPASGDRHDYMSLARYFWPDPSKVDGLPYINRDGMSNPELEKLDRIPLGLTADRVTHLALAWYFSGDEKYARKATELLRVWFLDKNTCMNPNLKYAQMIPGRNGNKGRSFGVLDAYSFVEMLDGVSLLESSKSFTKRDSRQLKMWFGRLLDWILTSPQGREEAAAQNNHGTVYDVQVIAYALYTGRLDIAEAVIRSVPEKRIFTQVEPDGRQPYELRRTLAFGYSQYNLSHYIDIFQMARNLGIQSIDNRVSADGRSFYKAMDFLLDYLGKDVQLWPYSQITGWEGKQQDFCKDLYRTYILNPSRKDYLKAWQNNRRLDFKDRFNLLYVRPTETDNAFAFAAAQFQVAIQNTDRDKREEHNAAKRRVSPRTMSSDGSLVLVNSNDWCSGFFPGSLWEVYAYTHDEYWRHKAISYTWPIEEAQWHKGTHDLGFIINNSFGKAYDLTNERSYRDVVIQAAQTLSARFNPTVGCIRSWDFNRNRWEYPVIIDNMMNLELLFRATQLTGDSLYWKIAVSHADTTMKYHFRPDYSSYHVVDYDLDNGSLRWRGTFQGARDDSFWARGQGWALYGYTMCYRFTHDPRYLKQACGIADFILTLINKNDPVPYWDMKSGIPGITYYHDASAAAVMASAFYELSVYTDASSSVRYRTMADQMLHSLYASYQSQIGANNGFLLLHSVGHYPGGREIDVPISYADYYYLEAMLRKQQLGDD